MLVLCADDDPDMLTLLRMNLVAEGFDVALATDGREALAVVGDRQPDLVVLDVMMPGCDGYEVLDSLKANAATRDLPVVLLSAKATDEEIWAGWRAGADYYLTKPFSMHEFMYFVRSVVDKADNAAPVAAASAS